MESIPNLLQSITVPNEAEATKKGLDSLITLAREEDFIPKMIAFPKLVDAISDQTLKGATEENRSKAESLFLHLSRRMTPDQSSQTSFVSALLHQTLQGKTWRIQRAALSLLGKFAKKSPDSGFATWLSAQKSLMQFVTRLVQNPEVGFSMFGLGFIATLAPLTRIEVPALLCIVVKRMQQSRDNTILNTGLMVLSGFTYHNQDDLRSMPDLQSYVETLSVVDTASVAPLMKFWYGEGDSEDDDQDFGDMDSEDDFDDNFVHEVQVTRVLDIRIETIDTNAYMEVEVQWGDEPETKWECFEYVHSWWPDVLKAYLDSHPGLPEKPKEMREQLLGHLALMEE